MAQKTKINLNPKIFPRSDSSSRVRRMKKKTPRKKIKINRKA